ncbi:MAG: c-type cytochrome [Pedosphaera parvula]|nr:c-type cytochrome [Pedosphaera parvula]
MEKEAVARNQIPTANQQQLLKHSDKSIREMAAKVFTRGAADRKTVLEQYSGVPELNGQPSRGADLFRQNCATCHRLKGEGTEIGADLGAVAAKPVQTLLVSILDPNDAVEDRYLSYTAATNAGLELSGIITTETPTSLTLRGADGQEYALLRSDLEELVSSGLSLMPEGFETAFQPQDLADLIAFIRSK